MFLFIESLIVVLVLILAYYKYSFQHWKKLNVPFALPSFPWGNYPNPLERKDNFGELVVKIYHDMKQQGHKYFGIFLFSQPCFVPADPKYIKLILAKDFNHFNYRNFYYNEKDDPVSAHLISLNGEKWRKLRNKLTPTFTTGKIKMVFRIFVECGKSMESTLRYHWSSATPFNTKNFFSSFSTDVIVNCAFGLEVDMTRKEQFRVHSKKAIDFNIVRCAVMYLGAAFPNLCRTFGFRQINKSSGDFFIDVVGSTVDYREKNNVTRKDFLQMLIDLKNEGEEMTIPEMAAQCFIFFLAGFETSATTMSFALYEITANPPVYQKCIEEIRRVLAKHDNEITYDAIREMTYLGQVIDETLRLHSPVYSVSRSCTQDYHFPEDNLVLKKGSQILIPIRGLHSDPEFYPEPEKFKPERFDPKNRKNLDQFCYLPFGEGPRICIGLRFAIMEIKTALVMALRKYKFTVNPKTIVPFVPNPTSLLYDVKGGIWLDCEKISD